MFDTDVDISGHNYLKSWMNLASTAASKWAGHFIRPPKPCSLQLTVLKPIHFYFFHNLESNCHCMIDMMCLFYDRVGLLLAVHNAVWEGPFLLLLLFSEHVLWQFCKAKKISLFDSNCDSSHYYFHHDHHNVRWTIHIICLWSDLFNHCQFLFFLEGNLNVIFFFYYCVVLFCFFIWLTLFWDCCSHIF